MDNASRVSRAVDGNPATTQSPAIDAGNASLAQSFQPLTHLSLFSGIGGIDLAADWAGFTTVAMVERDPFCQKVLAKNFPGVPIYDDVTTFDARRYRGANLVSAGFPCQPHSLAGKRRGSDDPRDLWSEVVRALRETDAEWFVGENVAGLFVSDDGTYFGRILGDLAALGYRVGWGCFGACDVDAPHKRERVFIVAYAYGRRRDARQLFASSSCQQGQEIRADGHPLWPAIKQLRATEDWESLASFTPRSDDGLPRRLDPCRALGNAVVPQQAYPILKAIATSITEGKK
jgi:DNA (cytosine-5)-methyltransferase 1